MPPPRTATEALSLCTLLLTTLLLALAASATPLPPAPDQFVLRAEDHAARSTGAPSSTARTHSLLDPHAESVGVLFTTAEADPAKGEGGRVEQLWLPRGRRVHYRDAPELPLHPLGARVTTLIESTAERAALESLERVVCVVSFRRGEEAEVRELAFGRRDQLVRLGGREVEAVECS